MIEMMQSDLYDDVLTIPRVALHLPLVLPKPPGFRPEDPATWPDLPGRLEYVKGKLLFMPPCGAEQQGVTTSTAGILDEWSTRHPEFFVGTNEAGMLLRG